MQHLILFRLQAVNGSNFQLTAQHTLPKHITDLIIFRWSPSGSSAVWMVTLMNFNLMCPWIGVKGNSTHGEFF